MPFQQLQKYLSSPLEVNLAEKLRPTLNTNNPLHYWNIRLSYMKRHELLSKIEIGYTINNDVFARGKYSS